MRVKRVVYQVQFLSLALRKPNQELTAHDIPENIFKRNGLRLDYVAFLARVDELLREKYFFEAVELNAIILGVDGPGSREDGPIENSLFVLLINYQLLDQKPTHIVSKESEHTDTQRANCDEVGANIQERVISHIVVVKATRSAELEHVEPFVRPVEVREINAGWVDHEFEHDVILVDVVDE